MSALFLIALRKHRKAIATVRKRKKEEEKQMDMLFKHDLVSSSAIVAQKAQVALNQHNINHELCSLALEALQSRPAEKILREYKKTLKAKKSLKKAA